MALVNVRCTLCGEALQVRTASLGSIIKCKACGRQFRPQASWTLGGLFGLAIVCLMVFGCVGSMFSGKDKTPQNTLVNNGPKDIKPVTKPVADLTKTNYEFPTEVQSSLSVTPVADKVSPKPEVRVVAKPIPISHEIHREVDKSKLAKSKLFATVQLMESGHFKHSRKRLQEIIDNYPETKSAEEAKELMEKYSDKLE